MIHFIKLIIFFWVGWANLVSANGTIDYFDITVFGGPHSFTIEDEDGNQIDFVVWPCSSEYQDGFDITGTDLNILTQQPFGEYEVQITGELGAYCDDDEQLDIASEWQITVEYESDIIIAGDGEDCIADGDVTGDGMINVIDVISIVNLILSSEEITDEQLCTYDITSDGMVNVIDVISVVNTILGT